MYQSHTSGTSPLKGIHWSKGHRKWRAEICKDGEQHNLGYYDDPIEAAEIYDHCARALFKEFARPNFPRPGEQGNT